MINKGWQCPICERVYSPRLHLYVFLVTINKLQTVIIPIREVTIEEILEWLTDTKKSKKF